MKLDAAVRWCDHQRLLEECGTDGDISEPGNFVIEIITPISFADVDGSTANLRMLPSCPVLWRRLQ